MKKIWEQKTPGTAVIQEERINSQERFTLVRCYTCDILSMKTATHVKECEEKA